MKKIFFYVVFSKFDNKKLHNLIKYLKYLTKIKPKSSQLIVLDLSRYYLGIDFNKKKQIEKKFTYFKVNNLLQLKKFCKSKKIYCFGLINQKIRDLFVLIIIKNLNFKLIQIMGLGYFPQSYNLTKSSWLYRIYVSVTYKSNYYFYRILSNLNLTPVIDYYFESSQYRIDKILNTQKNKKFIFFNRLPFFKNIIRINSQLYEKQKNIKKTKTYIAYIDSGFDHPDITTKEISSKKSERKKFYKNLYKSLKHLEKLFKKKVVFCKHPKSSYPAYFDKFEQNFITSTGHAEYYILNSYFVVLSATTLINYVIYNKKDFIISSSNYWGNLVKDKIESTKREVKFKIFNLDKNMKISKKIFFEKIVKNRKLISVFTSKNLVSESKLFHSEQMRNYLNNLD